MLEGIVNQALDWPVDDVIVALGSDADEIASRSNLGRATIIIDPNWAEGSASPIRAALDLVTRDRSVDRVMLVRGDQPGIEKNVVESLIETSLESDADVVVPKYRYANGWPVIIGPPLWDRFLSLEGSLDVLDVFASHAKSLDEVWFNHIEPHVIAVSDDLERS